MSRLTLIAAVLLSASVLAGGYALAADAEQLYRFYCAQCHGLGGKGDGPNVTEDFPVSPRNFTIAWEMNKVSDADLKQTIMDGGGATNNPLLPSADTLIMPPWSLTLTENEVDALIKHLRVLCGCKGRQD